MPSIPLQIAHRCPSERNSTPNPLPSLLQTPSGLAILELQGTINLPSVAPQVDSGESQPHEATLTQTLVGRIVFPDYDPSMPSDSSAWMKRVYLYVGRHQRLTGEVKKLPKPLAVIRRVQTDTEQENMIDSEDRNAALHEKSLDGVELEITEVIRYKLLFSSRPEPVSEGVE